MSMMRLAVAATVFAATSCIGSAVSARAQGVSPLVSSAAFGIQAEFTGGGMSTSLGPVAPVAGSAPPAYSRSKTVTAFSGAVAIPPLIPTIHPIVAVFSAVAAMLDSHVQSGGIGIDDVSAVGTSSIDSASLQISNPPPVVVTPPFLSVKASGVQAAASYSRVFPSAVSVNGSASFGSLAISGSLIGNATITYSGAIPANTVLYQSPTVTITAHQQIIAALISCPPCVAHPVAITVHALDITFNNAVVDGRPFSGDITLGDASASQ